MATIIGLPKLSPTMEEGVLVRWVKKEGDKVSPGDLVAEVETDKANMDFVMEDEGTLLKLLAKEGETVKLGAPVAILGNPGEDTGALEAEAKGGSGGGGETKPAAKPDAKAEAKPAAKADAKPAAKADAKPAAKADAKPAAKADARQDAAPAKAPAKPAAKAAPASGKGGLLASPLAKSLAIELGVDLRTVTGSGPGGRIVERDVRDAGGGGAPAEAAQDADADADAAPADGDDADHDEGDEKAAPAQAQGQGQSQVRSAPSTAIAVRGPAPVATSDADYTDAPASNMRKRIAARLTEAKRDVPHFYLMRTVNAAPLLAFRERLNALLGDKGKVSVNDLVVKAVALALRRLPDCNAAWAGDAIRHFHRVHIGIAVAIEDGLVTPVVFDADKKGIGAISTEVRDLATRAKNRQLKGHEITGSTFTVSNLGMFGIERFTAILNPPEAGILAVGAVTDVPVVQNGAVVAGKQMILTMSCDHRVIDGALGAKWMVQLVDLLEHPESLAL